MAGIVGWMAWSWAIFGGPLSFQYGTYAKPSLFLTSSEPSIGHWMIAIKTYWYAMEGNETWPMLLLSAIGLACFVVLSVRSRRLIDSLPVLSLLVTVPFFIVTLYTGQRPIHVDQISHNLYDVRFGLLMLLPTAIFTGYLVGSLQHFRRAMYAAGGLVLVLATGLNVVQVHQHNVVSYNEGARLYKGELDRVVTFLDGHYSGGRVLIQSFGNEPIVFQLPSNQVVYEGTYGQWLPALHDPARSHISWIIARCDNNPHPDLVCSTVKKAQLRSYELVYRSPHDIYYVYRLRK
jgi:hypothetical protein